MTIGNRLEKGVTWVGSYSGSDRVDIVEKVLEERGGYESSASSYTNFPFAPPSISLSLSFPSADSIILKNRAISISERQWMDEIYCVDWDSDEELVYLDSRFRVYGCCFSRRLNLRASGEKMMDYLTIERENGQNEPSKGLLNFLIPFTEHKFF